MEDVAGVHARGDVGQIGAGAVGQDGVGKALELGQVVDHAAAEEGSAVVEGGFVDNHRGAFGLDALHHALYRRLAEVVGVRLHRKPVNAYCHRVLGGPAGHFQNLIGNEILAGAVALHDGAHHVLRNVGIVGKQLLRVLWKAVAAVAERWVIIMCADARVEAYALDNGAGVEALYLGIGVELIEVAHPQGQISVGEELHRLGLLHAHK